MKLTWPGRPYQLRKTKLLDFASLSGGNKVDTAWQPFISETNLLGIKLNKEGVTVLSLIESVRELLE